MRNELRVNGSCLLGLKDLNIFKIYDINFDSKILFLIRPNNTKIEIQNKTMNFLKLLLNKFRPTI